VKQTQYFDSSGCAVKSVCTKERKRLSPDLFACDYRGVLTKLRPPQDREKRTGSHWLKRTQAGFDHCDPQTLVQAQMGNGVQK